MTQEIDYEVEPQIERDLGGGGSATRQNKENKPSLWQRIINWFKQLVRL